MIKLPNNKQLVLFDGVCNLCNTSVQYIIKYDKNNRFLFAPIQSNIGKQITESFKIDITKTDSILLYVPNKAVYTKSTAALKIAMHLSFPINLMRLFLITPRFIRDLFYNFIAKNRYKWFGKNTQCMVPNNDLSYKFLK